MVLSGLPEEVANEENLARFLTSTSQFNLKGVKPSVFLPEAKTQETSVFRHGAEHREDLWLIGDTHAANGSNIHGVAILETYEVRVLQLEVIADKPPPRHAAIRKWPQVENDAEMQKAQQLKLAVMLASKAQLLKRTKL